MTIELKPEQQRVIDLAVRSGAYQNPGEVLDQAFEIIREQLELEDWMLQQREEVSAHIAAGLAQAERVETEILTTCRRLARHPRMGINRQDITLPPVRFWTITKFPNYVIVYRPETVPLQVAAILHGKRSLKEVLSNRP